MALTPGQSVAQVCYQLPFGNPNLSDGWGSTCCGRSNPHRGVDFAQASGTAVPAVADGRVELRTWSRCLGNVLVIKHPDGYYSGYAHLSEISVTAGQEVRRGQRVARSGNTGTCTTGPHLHLTISPGRDGWGYGTTVDPVKFIKGRTANCDCDRRVDIKHLGSARFSCDGPAQGECVQLLEPEDSNTWNDNFLCTDRDFDITWSNNGPPEEGLDCTNLYETSSKFADAWSDNHLCVPNQSRVRLQWSSAGALKAPWSCVHFNEPKSQSDSFKDNYLCLKSRTDFVAAGVRFSTNGAQEGETCFRVSGPEGAASWEDNYICTQEQEGMVWTTNGEIAGMRCALIDAAEGVEGWEGHGLCVPEGSAREIEWSAHGPIEGLDCHRFSDTYDLGKSGEDNWFCHRSPHNDASLMGDAGFSGDAQEAFDESPTVVTGCRIGRTTKAPNHVLIGSLVLFLLWVRCGRSCYIRVLNSSYPLDPAKRVGDTRHGRDAYGRTRCQRESGGSTN